MTTNTCECVIRPKLVAFDLDGTVWFPDMYQLWGGGAPFRVSDPQRELIDKNGNPIRLLGDISRILHSLKFEDEWKGTIIAWVSCTDEPQWANECLSLFKSTPTSVSTNCAATAFSELVDSSEIYKANKQQHMRNLQKKFPEIKFEDMIFFDNEMHNIENTTRLGVFSVHCPDGVTRNLWEQSLASFASRHLGL